MQITKIGHATLPSSLNQINEARTLSYFIIHDFDLRFKFRFVCHCLRFKVELYSRISTVLKKYLNNIWTKFDKLKNTEIC